MTKFHDTPPSWFESVKGLAPGSKRRVGDGLLASFNGRAYHLYDFREKTSEVYEPKLTLAEKVAVSKAMREQVDTALQSPEMPEGIPHPQDWPAEARVWLHKAGLSNADIQEIGAVWHPGMARVLIPLSARDGTVAWQARAMAGDAGPKYLFPFGMRRGGGAFCRGYGEGWTSEMPMVITEDYLSAYRVNRDYGCDAVAALGTSLDQDALVYIAKSYPAALVWLDPDKYGVQGARSIREALWRLGTPSRMITSDKDPKNHEPGEIEIYLDEAIKALAL